MTEAIYLIVGTGVPMIVGRRLLKISNIINSIYLHALHTFMPRRARTIMRGGIRGLYFSRENRGLTLLCGCVVPRDDDAATSSYTISSKLHFIPPSSHSLIHIDRRSHDDLSKVLRPPLCPHHDTADSVAVKHSLLRLNDYTDDKRPTSNASSYPTAVARF